MGGSSYGVTIAGTQGTFQSCTCMSRWWPLLEDMCRKRGEPVPRVVQGSYRPATSYSARTHVGGGVVDLVTTGDWSALDTLMETMGAAAYERTPADGFSRHSHVILTGCPHLDPSAQRQIAAWMDLRNGLVSNRPDRDTTRPPSWRTYAEGVEWARRQLTVTTSPEEDEMTTEQMDQLADKVAARVLGATIEIATGADPKVKDTRLTFRNTLGWLGRYTILGFRDSRGSRVAIADVDTDLAAVAADLDALAAHLGNGGE